MPLWSPGDCRREFLFDNESEMAHDRTLCASGTGKSINSGDSGGPLLVPSSISLGPTSTWAQVGVASIRAYDSSGETISIYSRVSSFYEWIQRTVSPGIVFPHVLVGPSEVSTSATEVVITNTSDKPCTLDLLFRQKPSETVDVELDGRSFTGEVFNNIIPERSARLFTLTAPNASGISAGTVYLMPHFGCSTNSLHVDVRYRMDIDGAIEELLTFKAQKQKDWLKSGDCRILTGIFGQGRNTGLAIAPADPTRQIPHGSTLRFRTFDWHGNFVEAPPSLEITGVRVAAAPWNYSEHRIVEMCLDVQDDPNVRFAADAFSAYSTGGSVQYATEALVEP